MARNAIVVVAYNRPISLARILNRLITCKYQESVDLIISIDHSEDQQPIIDIANNIPWSYGEKIVISRNKRMGLKSHIIACGDLVEDYDAIIMFEDDIIPSKHFYSYVISAIKYYNECNQISGISLYSPQINEIVELPFQPLNNGYDAYFMQSVSSWGQCWTKEMWCEFRKWYDKNSDCLHVDDDMPKKIYNWPETSWKKYFMKFLVEKNKYFIYPYISLSTNVGDIGQHVVEESPMYQSPLLMGEKKYNFPDFQESIKYDSFYESINMKNWMENKEMSICIDLYGSKIFFEDKDYLLSTKKRDFKVIRSYGLSYKPQELNFIYDFPGNSIYLYDLSINEQNKRKNKKNEVLFYHSMIVSWKDVASLSIYRMINAIKLKINR